MGASSTFSQGPATDAGVVSALLRACVLACQASADACGKHASYHEHCKLHSERAGRCAEAVRSLEGAFASS